MKMPCELIVTHILPTARGALAKELVHNHGMTQVQVSRRERKILGQMRAKLLESS